jgi:transglutaminase-like putative cysteine protease
LLAIQIHISKHANGIDDRLQPKTLLESRLTPPDEAYARGMLSCGTIAGIAAEMLRHLGFQVKLVDGRIPETQDHAWISVYNPDNKSWEQYDLTKKDLIVNPGHIVELECNNWEEIREHLETAHSSYTKT